jgi:hypothetical protein
MKGPKKFSDSMIYREIPRIRPVRSESPMPIARGSSQRGNDSDEGNNESLEFIHLDLFRAFDVGIVMGPVLRIPFEQSRKMNSPSVAQ